MTNNNRISAIFGPRKTVNSAIIEGDILKILGGTNKGDFARVLSIPSSRAELIVVVLKPPTDGQLEDPGCPIYRRWYQTDIRLTLQAGQVAFPEKVNSAIIEGDVVEVIIPGPRIAGLARVISILGSRGAMVADVLLEPGDEQYEDPGCRLYRGWDQADSRLLLQADQVAPILDYGCMVRIEECTCNRRICKLLGPVEGEPGVKLQILNLEGVEIQGHPDELGQMAAVKVADEKIFDILKIDYFEKVQRVPMFVLYDIPIDCLTITHTKGHADRLYCQYCLRQGEWANAVCTDFRCIAMDAQIPKFDNLSGEEEE